MASRIGYDDLWEVGGGEAVAIVGEYLAKMINLPVKFSPHGNDFPSAVTEAPDDLPLM